MENNLRIQSLKPRSSFLILKEKGMRVYPSHWVIFNFKKNNHMGLRIGYTISKKIGNAVMRNKLKRWGREFFRKKMKQLIEHSLENKQEIIKNLDLNIVFKAKEKNFYKDLKNKEYDEIFEKGWRKIICGS